MATQSSHATLAAGAQALRATGPRANRRRGLLDLLVTWNERARERQQLLSLDERMLKDIGLTRADVGAEAAKPFWRP